MRKYLAVLLLAATACGPGGDPEPAPPAEPTPPAPQPSQPPPAEPTPPPSQPPPTESPPTAAACFLEEGGHGEWLYHFTRVEGGCGPGQDFTSNMAPGTSFIHVGPIPAVWDCETHMNVVSSDRCQKNISRHCFGEDTDLSLLAQFHQESPTRITFSFDERHEATMYTIACVGRYFGTITKQ